MTRGGQRRSYRKGFEFWAELGIDALGSGFTVALRHAALLPSRKTSRSQIAPQANDIWWKLPALLPAQRHRARSCDRWDRTRALPTADTRGRPQKKPAPTLPGVVYDFVAHIQTPIIVESGLDAHPYQYQVVLLNPECRSSDIGQCNGCLVTTAVCLLFHIWIVSEKAGRFMGWEAGAEASW